MRSNTEQKLYESCQKLSSLEQFTNEIYKEVKGTNERFGMYVNSAIQVISEIKSSFTNLSDIDKDDIMLAVPLTKDIINELGK